MYRQQDLSDLDQQIRRMRLLAVLCYVPFFIGMAVAIVLHSEIWAIILGLIGAFLAVFFHNAKVGLLKVYRRFVEDMLKGLHSTVRGNFLADEGIVLYERLMMHKLKIERESSPWTYYYDAQKTLPGWSAGDPVVIEISGDHIISYEDTVEN